jgi:polyhydroxybutyrate depolymerase
LELVAASIACIACGPGESVEKAKADAGDGRSAHEDTRPCGPSVLRSGTYTLDFAGVEYGYVVHLPPSYDGAHRTPLVLDWHSLSGSAATQEAATGMDVVSDEFGFLLVYPDSPDASWNGGACCAFHAPDRDDVGFALALVQEIEQTACVNTHRVYSTGMSNGGFMSYRLACEASDVFAAVAPVSAKVGIADCTPTRPVPVLAFHGTDDALVPYASPAYSGEGLDVPDTVERWASRNGCGAGSHVTYQAGREKCVEWSPCDDGSAVVLCTDEGGNHCWPGAPTCPFLPPTTDIDGNRWIAGFFSNSPLP